MQKQKPDYILLGVIVALILFGILILSSVSATFSQEKFGTPYYFLLHQVLYGLLPGLVLGFIAFKLPLSFFQKWSFLFILINIFLMLLVFVPQIGINMGGSARWLDFRIFSFQPSELLKLSFVLYLAAWLSKVTVNYPKEQDKSARLNKRANGGIFRKNLGLIETFLPFLAIIGVAGFLLILQPDIGTLGVIILSALVMYFATYTPIWHTFFVIFSGIAGLFFLTVIKPYRFNRLQVFLNNNVDPLGIGYQLKQALIAVGSGGILGLGLGMSRQKFGFLPESIGDSVFAIFSEETGFIGSLILISIFLFFAWQGFKIAKNCKDKFSKLLASGITFWIVFQGFVNIGSIVGILPLTGIPLPFISYGGTALVTELVAMGLLLNISKNTS